MGDLTCRELVELVTDYLDGALSPAERGRFDAHLAVCPHCRAYLAQMQVTVRMIGDLSEDDVAPDAKEALLAAFRGWKQRS